MSGRDEALLTFCVMCFGGSVNGVGEEEMKELNGKS